MDTPFTRKNSFEELEKPGDGYWTGSENPDKEPGRLTFKCPCGCDLIAGIKVAGEGKWQWNGDFEKPTTTPSILIDRGHWHGYLTGGVFRSC